MGKKRIAQKSGDTSEGDIASGSVRAPKKKVEAGRLYVQATYNNTKVQFTDTKGNVLCWSSSGSLGFKGARKGTPFAAAKVGELIGEIAKQMGVKDVSVTIKGVGSGRESAVRSPDRCEVILARGGVGPTERDEVGLPVLTAEHSRYEGLQVVGVLDAVGRDELLQRVGDAVGPDRQERVGQSE